MNAISESALVDVTHAIWKVQAKAEAVPTNGTTDDLRQALTAVRDAVVEAAETLNAAEEEARSAAIARLENDHVHA